MRRRTGDPSARFGSRTSHCDQEGQVQDEQGHVRGWKMRLPNVAGVAALILFPLFLAGVGYYRHHWDEGAPRWQLSHDSCFHMFQLCRSAEEGGRWWRVADEPLA